MSDRSECICGSEDISMLLWLKWDGNPDDPSVVLEVKLYRECESCANPDQTEFDSLLYVSGKEIEIEGSLQPYDRHFIEEAQETSFLFAEENCLDIMSIENQRDYWSR